MGKELTERTQRLIALIDSPDVRAQVTALFETEAELVSERLRFAVIKLALQGPQMFRVAAELFRVDWRDLLVNAGFADDLEAHEKWCKAVLTARDV